MDEYTKEELRENIIKKLKYKIVVKEIENIKTREKNKVQMVKWIRDEIEQEVKRCYSSL